MAEESGSRSRDRQTSFRRTYRFTEGAAYQRKSLACDRNYRPAKLQLSQDLLRLGEEAEGWRLADEVAKQDAYDVVAFNLVTLQDELTKVSHDRRR